MTISKVITSVVQMHRDAPSPAEKVWRALVEPAQVGTWLAAGASITPERGGAYELFWQPDIPEHNSTSPSAAPATSESRRQTAHRQTV